MKTAVIYVSGWKADEIDGYFNQLISDLNGEGIEVLENTSEVLRVIQTPKVYISFVDDERKLEGRRFDRMFRYELSRPDSKVIDMTEPIVDYVVSVEFGNR